jgi:hypothetical protein
LTQAKYYTFLNIMSRGERNSKWYTAAAPFRKRK